MRRNTQDCPKLGFEAGITESPEGEYLKKCKRMCNKDAYCTGFNMVTSAKPILIDGETYARGCYLLNANLNHGEEACNQNLGTTTTLYMKRSLTWNVSTVPAADGASLLQNNKVKKRVTKSALRKRRSQP